ncbi:MAG: hypothetical protein AB1665_07705 [Candidatus Thermoplasmatota archaeon]
MRRKIELTEKERLGLYHLVRYPTLNDREIAKKTGMKLSTVTAVRRRLAHQGYYRTIAIPRLEHVGFESLAVGYGQMKDRGTAFDWVQIAGGFEFLRKSFYMISDPNSELVIGMARNYTEIRRELDEFLQFFSSRDLLEEDRWHTALFPYDLSLIPNIFDFSDLLRRRFRIPIKQPKVEMTPVKRKEIHLTAKERRVLAGFVEYPEQSDSTVAQKVSVSRQTASTMHGRFHREGLTQTQRIPNLSMLGYQNVSFVHQKLNTSMPKEERIELLRHIYAAAPAYFFVAGATEFAMLTAHEDFQQYTEWMDTYYQALKKTNYRFSQPHIQIFSLPNTTEVRSYDFVPLTRYMLDTYPHG